MKKEAGKANFLKEKNIIGDNLSRFDPQWR